ncbi:MAG: FAD-dependent oxidoreductase [Lachnospiraceae bacterium]|jgi:NADPH-dependent glutamate synthase beta subunit-like oxidoreductase
MKSFKYEVAESLQNASDIVNSDKTAVLKAGGTDLLGVLKGEILPEYPGKIVDISKIAGLDGIDIETDKVSIGAMAKLVDICENADLAKVLPGVATAAHSIASPLIRNVGTIGGNICQDVRCWFYRYPNEASGRINCARKCGEECYAIHGDNRYHSIFGGYKIKKSECSLACPAGTDVPEYLAEVRKGNLDAAAEIIMHANPMPMITSRVCPHPCQDGCNQNKHGECVSIHCVERVVGDHILNNVDKFFAAPAEETGKKIAIIGAGPAGLSAAFYLRKAGHAVTVFDKMEKAGGVLMYGIPHYRLPKSIVEKFADALAGMGIEYRLGVEIGADITMEDIEAQYDRVFIGTGAWKQPILGLNGEELTQFGLNFLVEVNKYLKKVAEFGDNVLVCGGGNVAMDVALTAVRLGAKNITLVCLEKEEQMPAAKEEIARAKEEGVRIINGRGLSKVIEENGKVIGLETMKCVSVFDEYYRFNPVYDNEDKTVIEADTIILATGQRVDLDFLGDNFAAQIKSKRGLVKVEEGTYKTANDNLYGAGDAVTGPNIAIRAVAGGAAAARAISASLGTKISRITDTRPVLSFDPEGVEARIGVADKELPVGERTLTDEDSSTISLEEAKKEAGRCMDCGCYAVSPSDLAPMLIATGADIVTTNRTISADEFFLTSPKSAEVLGDGEIVTRIDIPVAGYKTNYLKFRLRDAIDFAIVGVASAIKVTDGKIEDAALCYSGVSPMPRKDDAVAEFIKGKEITVELADEAGALAVKDCITLAKNAYKVEILRTLVRDSILAAK